MSANYSDNLVATAGAATAVIGLSLVAAFCSVTTFILHNFRHHLAETIIDSYYLMHRFHHCAYWHHFRPVSYFRVAQKQSGYLTSCRRQLSYYLGAFGAWCHYHYLRSR